MRSFFALAIALTLTGCASLGVNDPNLRLKVEPDPAVRGKNALFILNAPMEADRVTGVLEIFTNPSFQFKKDLKKKYWFISEKIPETILVPPGVYSVRLFYSFKDGKPRYMRKKLELK